jgi:hypothetical protein
MRWETLGLVMLLGGCDGNPWTLYRNSNLDAKARIHIATFDANENDDYNRENCLLAQGLFKAQPDIRVLFWCERGRYKSTW